LHRSVPPDPAAVTGLQAAWREVGSLARLAAPLVAGLVASTGMGLVDTAMLGPLGVIPLAAVSLTSSIIVIFYAALYGFAGPVGLFAGRAYGEGRSAALGRLARHACWLAMLAGAIGAVAMAALLPLLSALGQPADVIAAIGPYWLWMSASLVPFTLTMAIKNLLDATEQAWTGVLLTLLPVVLNIGLNWVLIYGHLGAPALGLTGAGLGSFLAQSLGAAAILAYARLTPSLAAWWTDPGHSRREFRDQSREGLPMSAQYFMEGAAAAIAGVMIGYFGAVALAGNQIALSVANTLYMLPLGMAGAVSIRIAQAAGAGASARIRAIGHAGLGVVSLWMGIFAVVFFFAGPRIAAWFVNDPAVIAASAAILFVFGFTQLMDGVQSVSLGALRGMLDNRWPTWVSLIAYWLLALPLAWLFGFGLDFGAPGIWAGFGFGLLFAAAALLWRFETTTRRAPPEPVDRG
jgi:MATE family multidrug resistance protein